MCHAWSVFFLAAGAARKSRTGREEPGAHWRALPGGQLPEVGVRAGSQETGIELGSSGIGFPEQKKGS